MFVGPADEPYGHDIDSSLKKHTVKNHTLVGPEDDDRSFGGHVPVGDDDDDDDDACSPPLSVFPISFDCLDLHVVGTEDEMHIESQVGSEAEGNVAIGKSCDVGWDRDGIKSHGDSSNVVGSEPSPSSTTRRRQQQT